MSFLSEQKRKAIQRETETRSGFTTDKNVSESSLGLHYKQSADVYRRTQNEGGIKTVSIRRVSDLDAYGYTEDVNITSYDSFTLSKGLLDNPLNKEIASKLVTLSNFPHRKGKGAQDLQDAKDAYTASLRSFNLCDRCRLPLVLKHAQIVRIAPNRRQSELWIESQKPFAAHLGDYVKSQLLGELKAAWPDFFTERDKSIPYFVEVENEIVEYSTERTKRLRICDYHYADIQSHYEVYDVKTEKGVRKFYGLQIGENEPIQSHYQTFEYPTTKGKMRKVKTQILKYYTHDGKPLASLVPPASYRVVDLKCNCLLD